MQNYIYLDSKIIGTAVQIVVFFNDGIFQRENTIILIKKYKHKSAKQLASIFHQNNIVFRFVQAADLDQLSQGNIFYPFNAQSNVRAVANRNLGHIFITHGESNKAASVKPIIRVYDHVTTAGQAGIDRFISNNIFSKHDTDCGRLLTMGDAFIGKTGLSQDLNAIPCIFYAPTWEGGIEQENYSSLAHIEAVVKSLLFLCDKNNVRCIIIQPHPNTGYRLKKYQSYLIDLALALYDRGTNIFMYKNFPINHWNKYRLKLRGVKFIRDAKKFTAKEGICDISAMETQLLNEDIPYHIFWDKQKHPDALFNERIYCESTLNHIFAISKFWEIDGSYISHQALKDYIIDPRMSMIPRSEKIHALLSKIKTEKKNK